MKQTWNAVQTAFVVIGGMIGRFLGGADGALYALIAFAVIDYVTGVLRGTFERKLSSEVGFRGQRDAAPKFRAHVIGVQRHAGRQRRGNTHSGSFLPPLERGRVDFGERLRNRTADTREVTRRTRATT